MSLKLYNTRSRSLEEFKPIETGKVRMYHCGPTAYGRQHIGNLYSAVVWDILRRSLEYLDYDVTQVINVTDFGHLSSDNDTGEDKMFKGLRCEGLPISLAGMKTLAQKYTDIYLEDREALNALEPHHLPFATAYIDSYIEMITTLEAKGFAYTCSDGVYFDTTKDPNYGALTPRAQAEDESQTRSGENSEKKSFRDFALWKFNQELGFESPWGQGFPGWHIECSGMSRSILGDSFDIHTGGIEHIAIHHNNEIAQSENTTGKPMAHYWLHNNHLILPEGKMAKSSGNFVTLDDLEQDQVSPLALRYLFIQNHYRSELMYSQEALQAASTGLRRLKAHIQALPEASDAAVDQSFKNTFIEALEDDLATPRTLALVFEVLKSDLSESIKKATVLDFDRVLGLKLDEIDNQETNLEIPEDVIQLAEARHVARKARDWSLSDEIRDKITALGYEVIDEAQEYKIVKK